MRVCEINFSRQKRMLSPCLEGCSDIDLRSHWAVLTLEVSQTANLSANFAVFKMQMA